MSEKRFKNFGKVERGLKAHFKKEMEFFILPINKITKRWFFNNFVVILLILIVIEVFISLGIKSFYYNSVERFLKSQGLAVVSLIDKVYDDDLCDFDFELRTMVENFEQRDKMEMMFLNSSGEVLLTSGTFEASKNVEMPDYQKLTDVGNNDVLSKQYARSIYMLDNQNVMAVIYPVKTRVSDVSYVRFVSSITGVDKQVIIVIAITVLIGICVIFFVVLSSSYFIQSIVVPIDEIVKIAKKISQGDFAIRLEKKTDDEIGILCETINNMAEELSVTEKLKNEFISSISHELRTPLTAIKGWAETVSDSESCDKNLIKKSMKVITSETERLSSMVEELLDFSRIQNRNMKLILTKLDLIAELEDIIIVFEERAKKEDIRLFSQLPTECVLISGDRNRLRQVFTNVIDNALKYSEKGQEILVTAEQKKDLALIKIIDNGCGINPKDLPKVKNKFYKANYSKRGSGIGLAVADEIIKLHNGSLDIYSVEGEGTTIVIQIPIIKKYIDIQD